MFAKKEPRSGSSSTSFQRSNQPGQSSFFNPKKKDNKGKGKEKETTETPFAQVAEANDFSQLHTIWEEELDKLIPEYWQELDLCRQGSNSFELPPTHHIFRLIENTINRGIRERPYTAPKQEATRMEHARGILNDENSTSKQKEKAKLRLREGEKGGAPLVRSGEIEIIKISVMYNEELWDSFSRQSNDIKEQLKKDGDNNPLEKVKWSITPPPVIDQSSGEALLFHGSAPDIIDKIEEGGFRPDLGRNKGTSEAPKYGLMGQGTYFSDNMSKVMTYSTGYECQDYQCESEEEGSQVIVARTVLGHPKKMHGFLQPGGNLRDQSHDSPLKEGRHSVYSEGLNVSKNPFSAGSGTNEFLIKRPYQAYPEFRIVYRRRKN